MAVNVIAPAWPAVAATLLPVAAASVFPFSITVKWNSPAVMSRPVSVFVPVSVMLAVSAYVFFTVALPVVCPSLSFSTTSTAVLPKSSLDPSAYVAVQTAFPFSVGTFSSTLYVPAVSPVIVTVPLVVLLALMTSVSLFLLLSRLALTSPVPATLLPVPLVTIFIATSDVITTVYGVGAVGAVSPASSLFTVRL